MTAYILTYSNGVFYGAFRTLKVLKKHLQVDSIITSYGYKYYAPDGSVLYLRIMSIY